MNVLIVLSLKSLHIYSVLVPTHNKCYSKIAGNDFFTHVYLYLMFGAISGIEPSDKINVKNMQKPREIISKRVSRNIKNLVSFFQFVC